MRKINFTKMVASGNDFVVIEGHQPSAISYQFLSRKICNKKFGVGADGLLVLEKSRIADIKMRIFNPDGSEAKMCGNGARCVALYLKHQTPNTKYQTLIETKAGIIESRVKIDNVKIKLSEPKNIKLDIPIRVNSRLIRVNFIDTGVPHAVIFVEGLDKIDVFSLGRPIRYHKRFMPSGANVDFVEVSNRSSVKIKTYERGVESETSACGTGAVAAALITDYRLSLSAVYLPARQKQAGISDYRKINVHTKSGEILKVYFHKIRNKFRDIWLEGRARIVYKGEYYV